MMRLGLWRPILLLAGFLVLGSAAFADSRPLPADWPAYLRPSLFPKWVDSEKKIDWPPPPGCKEAEPVADTVAPGALIDRFGDENGYYFSPLAQPFARRSLPYVCSQMAYTIYRVTQPVGVLRCTAAPWFGEPGGATQYKTAEPVSRLLASGVIEVARIDTTPDGRPIVPCRRP